MRIGLVLNILDEEFQISIYTSIKQNARKLGVELICFQLDNVDFTPSNFAASLPGKKYFQLDGIIILTSVMTEAYNLKLADDLKSVWGDVPVLTVGQPIEGYPSILIQSDQSMKQMIEHLILEHKYRHFLFVGGTKQNIDARNRERLFKQIIEEYKSVYNDLSYEIICGYFTERGAAFAAERFFEENPDKEIDAVVCANDNMAIGVLKFFRINKNKKECAVTGFDDIPQSRIVMPSITTVRQPLEKIGEQALKNIISLVKKEQIPENCFIESDLVIRESCGCNKKQKWTDSFLQQMQSNYLISEQSQRLITRFVQELNYCNEDVKLKQQININMDFIDINDLCVLRFNEFVPLSAPENILDKIDVTPVYVKRNGIFYENFLENKSQKLSDFYINYTEFDKDNPKYLNFKFLTSGNLVVGCIFYNAQNEYLSHLTSASVSIAQTIFRIHELEERKRHADYLEAEVNKRTKELIEANDKRMEVEAEVLRISEIERQRFSTDLHDDICQRLAGISMLCRSYSNQDEPVEKQQMIELAQLISDTLQTTRQYAHNSYPVELDSLGLNHSLSNLCNSFSKQVGFYCDYEWNVDEKVNLDNIQKLNIFRIIQEALHNVGKHARAKTVSVTVTREKKNFVISIEDDGIGITDAGKNKKGLGLKSMEYRANQIGARFKISNRKGGGTSVLIELKNIF